MFSSARNSPTYLAVGLGVALISAAIYLGCIVSPPSLMDDVDAVQAQIARNMLDSGDWVTARLDGVPYLEKAPLIYWLIAICYKIFGVHDWAARIPVALATIGLAWLTAAMGVWAFGRRAGFYAGLCMATCIGLFLFTRIQIPDVDATASIALALWAFLRVMDEGEARPRLWAAVMAASMGVGLLLKSLIGVVFPVAAAALYLLFTASSFQRKAWQRLQAMAAASRSSWRSRRRGTFWRRCAIRRISISPCTARPASITASSGSISSTSSCCDFWTCAIRTITTPFRASGSGCSIWCGCFPWSVYLPAAVKTFLPAGGSRRPHAHARALLDRLRPGLLHVFHHAGVLFDAVLSGAGAADRLRHGGGRQIGWNGERASWARWRRARAIAVFTLWFLVRNTPAPGDISGALSHNPGAYTLSLGHMEDLTIESFAYLRAPLLVAGVAFAIGAVGVFLWRDWRTFLAAAAMMVVFFHAARMALVTFDPFLSSRPLAEALLKQPPGTLVIDHHYYTFSSVFFYTGRRAWLLNGRFNNLVYGSYAPGAPDIFLDDETVEADVARARTMLSGGGRRPVAAISRIGGRRKAGRSAAQRR